MAATEPDFDPAAMRAVTQWNALIDHFLSVERSEDDLETIKRLQESFSDYLRAASRQRFELQQQLANKETESV
jgi:hypothetical protein